MESKLIIFLAFLSLAQGLTALSLTTDYGLSEDQFATLAQIIVNQDAKVQAVFDAFDPIFDLIEKYVSALIWNVEAGTDDDSSEIAKALIRVKDAIDYSLDSVSISLQKSCDAVEVARNAAYADADNLYAVATEAFTLAQSGNYSVNQPQLEKYRDVAQEYLKDLILSLYESIRTCLATSGVDTLEVVQAAQNGSVLALSYVPNALFNAIKLYAAAVTAGTADVSLISEIEDCRKYARFGLRTDAENKFGVIKTLYIATQLNLTEIVSGLATNQYARTVSFYRFEAGMKAVFNVINARLAAIALGLYNAGDADSSLTILAQAEAVTNLKAGHEVFLMSIISARPDAVSAVAAARKIFSTLSKTVVKFYFDAITAAQCQNSSHSKWSFNARHSNHGRSYVDLIYNLLRNDETWDEENETEFKTYKDAATDLINTVIGSLFDATKVLAKATKAGKTNAEDFSAINADKTLAIAALDTFAKNLSAAGVITLKAANKLSG